MEERLQLKLSQLRDLYKSADSAAEIDRIEKLFEKYAHEKQILEQPIFRDFAAVAEKNLNDLNALLLNDDSLLNDAGLRIVHQRNFWRAFFAAFGVRPKDEALRTLEESVDYKLGE